MCVSLVVVASTVALLSCSSICSVGDGESCRWMMIEIVNTHTLLPWTVTQWGACGCAPPDSPTTSLNPHGTYCPRQLVLRCVFAELTSPCSILDPNP